MRIVIDIDGTICETKKHGQTYENVRVNPGAVEKIKALKDAGHYIILQTARHMKTMNGDVSKVIEKVGAVTEKWLKDNNIVYDELHFGKPYNQIIIDDRSFWFEGWENFNAQDFNSEQINIVFNLTRTQDPFISVLNKTILEWTLESFKQLNEKFTLNLIFIINDNQIKELDFEEKLIKIFDKEVKIVKANENINKIEVTSLIKPLINNLQQLVVVEDLQFFNSFLVKHIIEESNLYGILTYIERENLNYGCILNDQWGFVAETHEKLAKTSMYSTGVYYFRTGRDLISCANYLLQKHDIKSVISCYNELVNRGQQVKAIKVEDCWPLNSPEQISNFENNIKSKQI